MSEYTGKLALITGGSGFIGRHLARRLLTEGAHVVVFARGVAVVPGAERVRGDVKDEGAVSHLIARGFDYVFHLAAESDQRLAAEASGLATNCQGLRNVLEAARRASPRAVVCVPSTRLVYGRARYLPVDETHPVAPRSAYAAQKLAGEALCAQYAARWGTSTVVLRLSNPYGSHQTNAVGYNVANRMIAELVAGRDITLFGRGEQLRDYVYIDDAVDAIVTATADKRAFGQVYNVGSGDGIVLADFARTAERIAGAGGIAFGAWPASALALETGDYVADISKIRAETGWAPAVPLAEGIRRTVAAQRSILAATRSASRSGRLPEPDDIDAELKAAA